jgi:hypothetical protein
MEVTVSIQEIKIWVVAAGKSLKAKVDLTFNMNGATLTLKGFRIVEPPGRSPFVAPPQEHYRGKDGKEVYKDLIWLDRTLQEEVYPKIIQEFKARSA